MLSELPGWVVDNDTSVREEVAEWIGLPPHELWRLARMCARDAMWAASSSGMKQRILDQTDPLPESTVAALTRLRREAGWPRGV